jgi:hypothetical protein
MPSYISPSSPVASITVATESHISYKNNENISIVTSFATDEGSNLMYIILYVFASVGTLAIIIGALFYIRRRRRRTRIQERNVQYTTVPLNISEPLHYYSVDVTKFQQVSASATGTDIMHGIRVENSGFVSFKGV